MKNIIIIFSIITILISCNDFLEPQSESEIIPDKAESLNELLLGEAYPRNSGRIYIDVFLGLLDDDIEYVQFVPEENITFNPMMEPIKAAYTWQTDLFSVFRISQFQASIYNVWQNAYRGILGCNAVLDYIPQVSGSQSQKDYVVGQALALRAFYNFHLVNVFGEPYNHNPAALSIPLKLDANVSLDGKKRNTVAEVYSSILSDLLSAESLFENLPVADQWKQDFRVSLPMVQLLLSRVYLYMENGEAAARYGKKVIENSQFSLIDLNNTPQATEDAPYYNFMNYYNNSELIWLYGQVNDAFHLSILQSTTNAPINTNADKALFKASSSLMNLYDSIDLRPKQYIFDDYSGNYKVPMGKIQVDANRNISSEGFARGFKLAEAYLNTAEAYALLSLHENDASAGIEALKLLNDLRSKRYTDGSYTPLAGLSPQILLQTVREERRRELCFEGHRWFDLRRQGMPAISHPWWDANGQKEIFTLEEKGAMYTLPIPDEAIIQNPELMD